MTIFDAAHCLGQTEAFVVTRLLESELPIMNQDGQLYFSHKTAARFFQFDFEPNIFAFQILKGGTGKTSLAFEFAVRANLYGAEVLCIDLDSQGNLTQSLNQNAEEVPVMIDHLVEEYSIYDSIVSVKEGLDLIPSRIENAMLDEVIREKRVDISKVYRTPFQALKSFYDVIVIDCPPSLGQSVAATALSADMIIAPMTPEKYSLFGWEKTLQMVQELEDAYQTKIPCFGVLNKFEPLQRRSFEFWNYLNEFPDFQGKILPGQLRLSSEFSEAQAEVKSIFDKVLSNFAKEDVDHFTQILLGIKKLNNMNLNLPISTNALANTLLEDELIKNKTRLPEFA